jgi:hypothetical protein
MTRRELIALHVTTRRYTTLPEMAGLRGFVVALVVFREFGKRFLFSFARGAAAPRF